MKIKTKRLFALVLALCIVAVCAMPLGALAAKISSENGNGTITITDNSGGVSVADRTFELYEIFAATSSGSNVSYQWALADTTNESLYYDFFYTNWTDSDGVQHDAFVRELGVGETGSIQDAVDAIEKLRDNATEMSIFATNLYKYIEVNGIEPTRTQTAGSTDTSVSFTELQLGYYLVYDATDLSLSQTVSTRSSVILLTTDDNTQTVALKVVEPTIDKEVAAVNGDTKDAGAVSASIGDTITFEIEAIIPDTSGYVSYTYDVYDTMSYGLTYVTDSVTATHSVEGTLVNPDDYTVTVNTVQDQEGNDCTQLVISFLKVLDNNYAEDSYITITYDAILNANAEQINGNEAYLEYSNDPTGGGTGKTEETESKVYTYDLQITKKDQSGNTLPYAEFQMYTSTSIDQSGDPVWELMTFYVDTATDLSGNDITVYRVYDEDAWIAAYNAAADPSDLTTTLVADAYGNIYIEGIGGTIDSTQYVEGYYKLVETTAPDGYQIPTDEFTFTYYTYYDSVTEELYEIAIRNGNPQATSTQVGIIDRASSITGGITSTTDYNGYEYASFAITNKSGSALPTTGGMGTTLFIIGGIILMALAGAAVVLLVKDKKKA